MKLGNGRVPPRGWHYDEYGIKDVPSREMLVQQIFEHRMRRGIPIGDVQRDIDDYYCQRWPEQCQKERHEYIAGAKPMPSEEPMLNRVTRWASLLARTAPRGGWPMVTDAEATKRASFCVGCPVNRKWRGGCAGCSSSTAQLLINLRGLRRLGCEGSLMGCHVMGWENATAVHLKRVDVSDYQRSQLPDKCWAKSVNTV